MSGFNLNELVKVRLNDVGKAHLDVYYANLRLTAPPVLREHLQPPVAKDDGMWVFQLHQLMRIFGPVCSVGLLFPFEDGMIYPVLPAPAAAEGGEE